MPGSLTDYQYEYRGLVMGDNTVYDFIDLEGIEDMIVKDDDRSNPRSHGMIPGIHHASFRLLRGDLEVRGTYPTLETAVNALLTAMSPDGYEVADESADRFYFKFPGKEERFVYGRPVRRSRPRRNDTEFGLVPIRFELKVYDPRIYAQTEDDSGVTSGTFNVTNNGDAFAYPILVFDPDVSGVAELTNNTNGDYIRIGSGAGATSGLTADMGRWARGRADLLIIYRGSTNHYGLWNTPRMPFRLSPGINSLTLNTGDSVRVYSRDTWM